MEPAMLMIVVAAVAVLAVAYFVLGRPQPKLELHGYQIDFLSSLAEQNGTTPAGALQSIIDRAQADPAIKGQIFDGFHCIHCGSVSPADWIATRKGKKDPYALSLSGSAISFLSSPLLVKVEKLGDPPTKQVVDAPLRADASKAARCCVDWAIKNHGALADGAPKPE